MRSIAAAWHAVLAAAVAVPALAIAQAGDPVQYDKPDREQYLAERAKKAMVVRELGEEEGLATFRDIAKNGFSERKGHTPLAGLVASGEVPFALTTYSHGAEKMKQRGAPVEWFAIEPAIGRANGVVA